jgi:hypothetical protein
MFVDVLLTFYKLLAKLNLTFLLKFSQRDLEVLDRHSKKYPSSSAVAFENTFGDIGFCTIQVPWPPASL